MNLVHLGSSEFLGCVLYGMCVLISARETIGVVKGGNFSCMGIQTPFRDKNGSPWCLTHHCDIISYLNKSYLLPEIYN